MVIAVIIAFLDDSDDLIKRLIAIIQEYALVTIGGLILVKDYQLALPGWVKNGIGHPVCMAFAVCLEEFIRFLNGMDAPIRAPRGDCLR
jgi:hypothetical protein